jgi:hypothetical protein
MPDTAAHRHPDDQPTESRRGSTDGTPRWVKVSGGIALLVVLLVVVMLIAGGGRHGPSRHAPSGEARDRAPSGAVTRKRAPSADDAGGHRPPAGGH